MGHGKSELSHLGGAVHWAVGYAVGVGAETLLEREVGSPGYEWGLKAQKGGDPRRNGREEVPGQRREASRSRESCLNTEEWGPPRGVQEPSESPPAR